MTDLVQTSEMTSRSAWLAVGSVIALLAVTGAALPFVFLWAAPDVYESGAAMMVSFLQVGIALGALAGGAILDAQGRDHDLPRRGGRERGRHTCLRIGRLPLRSSRKSNMKTGVRKMKTKGATIFVTGANRGIGLAFAREALVMGAAKVYAGMRKAEGFSEPGMIPVQIDVTNPESIRHAAAQCGDVSILVNNAGIAELVSDALDDRVEAVTRAMMEVNLFGIVRVTQAFAPVLATKPQSAVINVLSDVSWKTTPILTPYSASKAAAWSYTNHARIALKEQNTAVVGLHVGFVDTDLTAGVDVPKSDPRDVARKSYDVLEAGGAEVLADEGTVKLKASLSAARPEYIYPEG